MGERDGAVAEGFREAVAREGAELDPQTLLLHLEEIRPGQEWYRRKRTLQRRVEQWRALHGPGQEVMFLQEHHAGVLGISDFTVLKGEPITVAGAVLEHRLFHFRLPFSGWCHVEVIHGGESFVALSEGLQNALAACGGVPAEHLFADNEVDRRIASLKLLPT